MRREAADIDVYGTRGSPPERFIVAGTFSVWVRCELGECSVSEYVYDVDLVGVERES